METVFVLNQPVMSCCGRPRAECTCQSVHNQPQGLPQAVYNWDQLAEDAMYTHEDVHKRAPTRASVTNSGIPETIYDWESMAKAALRR